MKPDRVARLCRVGGLAAVIIAPIPFLVFFYRLATTKVNDIPQDQFVYHSAYWSAFLLVAGLGFALGCSLLVFGWRFRSKRREVST
jgi:cell division protein FtsX